MFFVWDESLDTGIDVIDKQHRKIVDYMNELHAAIANKDLESVPRVVKELLDYTVSHFSFEEQLMEQHGYQQFEEHRRVHQMFTRRMSEYQRDIANGRDISRKLLNDLKIWLISHIKSEDSDYVRVIKNRVDKGWVSRMLGRFFH